MRYIKIEGKDYLLWLVENILDAVGNPLPDQCLISLGRPQTVLFESLIKLGVLALEPVPRSYDKFVKGEKFDEWMLANTSLKPLSHAAPTPTIQGGGKSHE